MWVIRLETHYLLLQGPSLQEISLANQHPRLLRSLVWLTEMNDKIFGLGKGRKIAF